MTAQALNTRKTVASEPKALDRVLDYNAKVRLMVIEVLREESGRELQSAARFNGEDFDWETHNVQFRTDYAETSIKELLAYASELYGLNDMNAVRERRKAHKAQRAKRLNAQG